MTKCKNGCDEPVLAREMCRTCYDVWYNRNIRDMEHQRQVVTKRKKRLRKFVTRVKRRFGCTRCGESEPACLEFHHRNPEEKTMGICNMATNGYGLEKIKEEMRKCDILCCNCHRKKHAGLV